MSPKAPITQDVMTIPRKLPEGKVNLVGLTRDELRAGADRTWHARESRRKCGSVRSGSGSTSGAFATFGDMTNLAKAYRAQLAEELRHRNSGTGDAAGLGRRHAQIPVSASPAGMRLRLSISRKKIAARSACRQSGGLHADLFLLPYGDAKAGAQPDGI